MKCPNCSGEIGRFELSPNCKHCGVNIYYSQQKKFLADDAKMCELEYAVFRILVSKLKTSFIKGPIVILRIVAMVIAIGSIFVPFATVTTDLPLVSVKFSFGAWGIYNAFSDATLFALIDLKEYMPEQVYVCLALLVLMVIIFLVGFGIFVALLLSFINIQKSAKIMRGMSIAGGVLCLIATVVSFLIPSMMAKGGFLQGEFGIGAIGCFLVFCFIFILNNLVIKKNIQPEIKDVDIKRVQMKKKVKAGEVSLDELTLPVFESEEEREKRLAAEEKSRLLAEKGRSGE